MTGRFTHPVVTQAPLPSSAEWRVGAAASCKFASVKAAALELQGVPIDLLVNNAGIGGPRGQAIGNIDYETWRHVLDVNTLGPIRR